MSKFQFDPSMLTRPLSELNYDTPRDDGIQVEGADALLNSKAEEGAGTSDESADESKVPYSRFKKFHDLAKEAQEQAAYWREQAEQRTQRQESSRYEAPAPSNIEPQFQGTDWERFKTLYGGADENAVKEAYRLEMQRISAVEERATQRAIEAMEQRAGAEQKAYQQNLSVLDENLEAAADIMGRALKPDEELAILEIQDDYSPKDRNGRIEALLPIEKAVEIYEMQSARSQAPRRQARNAIAGLSGSSSGGDTSVAPSTTEQYSKFAPNMGWRANFQRMTGRNAGNV